MNKLEAVARALALEWSTCPWFRGLLSCIFVVEQVHFTYARVDIPNILTVLIDSIDRSKMRSDLAVVISSVLLGGLFYVIGLDSLPYPYETTHVHKLTNAQLNSVPIFPAVFTDAFMPNNKLQKARRLFEGQVFGAESVSVDSDGVLTMLDKFGFVHRAHSQQNQGTQQTDFVLQSATPRAYLGPGRPLGYHFRSNGKLVVCDSLKGLVELEIGGANLNLKILSNSFLANSTSGTPSISPIDYVNDLDILHGNSETSSHDVVFFSSSTAGVVARNTRMGHYDTMRSFLLNFCAGDQTGRLFK
jgi:hypothetical protein